MFKNAAAEFVYVRTYSRWVEELSRRETWPETVDRYVNYLQARRGEKIPKKVLKKIRQYLLNFEVMPSMRALWSAGDAADAENLTFYNCSFANLDSPEAFAENMYILMCGVGYGFRVTQRVTQEVDLLPPIPKLTSQSYGSHTVDDSRAGWAESVRLLIAALYDGKDLDLDYSKVRLKGSRLKTMGGRASGPAPLITLHNFIRETFAQAQGRKLTTLERHDISMQVADSAVMGGSRRASEISLSDLDDLLLRHAKDGAFHPRRFMSNNSAVYETKPSAVDFLREWSALASSGSGERGIFNLGSARLNSPKRRDASKLEGCNPCKPLKSLILTPDGYVTFKQALAGGEFLEVVTNVGIKKATKPFLTKENAVVSEVILSNGMSLYGTPDHRHMDVKGNWVEIKDFVPGMELKYNTYSVAEKYINQESVFVSHVVHNSSVENVYDITVLDGDSSFIDTGITTHNCGEILLRNRELCNLSEVVVRAEDDVDSLLDKVEAATWIGVIQSTFTDFKYISPEWAKNCEEERLLGVSLTGQMDNPGLLTPSVLRALKSKAIKVAKHASGIMGINMPAAVTAVKPSGSVSQVVDSASGLHTRFSKWFVRRYRIAAIDPLFKMLRDQGVEMKPENGQTAETANTWVISFPVKAPDGCVTRHDMDAIKQLEWYKKIQQNWCEHNASCTVYVKDEEWFEVGNWVYKNWDVISGVSFLPYDGGNYEQAPYEEIDEAKYNELVAKFPKIDYTHLSRYEMEDGTSGAQTLACSAGGICELN